MRYIMCVGILLLFSSNISAQICQAEKTIDIVQCGLKFHPQILKQEEITDSSQSLINIANQIPNPEIDASFSGLKGGGYRTEFGLIHTFERGDKKKSRSLLANSEIKKAESDLLMIKSEAFIEIWELLHQLRQLREFIELSSEIKEVYEHSSKKYRSRKWKSKSQQLDFDLINLAKEEIETKIVLLKTTVIEKKSMLMSLTNTKLVGWSWLPGRPELEELKTKDEQSISYAEDALISDLETSRNKLELERSKAVNDISLGPIIELENTPSETLSASFGVQLSMNIPISHQNAGQIEFARRRIEREAITLNQWKKSNSIKISAIKSVYENSIKRLAVIYKNSTNHHFHESLDKQAKSGLLSPTTVTEAHRQILQNLEGTHALEMKALMAKWQYKQLNGTLLKEVQ